MGHRNVDVVVGTVAIALTEGRTKGERKGGGEVAYVKRRSIRRRR